MKGEMKFWGVSVPLGTCAVSGCNSTAWISNDGSGFKCNNIARNTIANANEVRDYRIYEELANVLTARAKELYGNEKVLDELEFDKSIYALDSSVINICFSLAPWTKYMETKEVGAIKLHSLIDLKGNIPSFNVITDGKVYDGKIGYFAIRSW